MKKILSILLAIMIVLSCGACSPQPSDGSGDSSATEYTMSQDEIVLSEILILGSNLFRDPTSTKVKNVWLFKGTVSCYYTFEIESKNGNGDMTSAYYGGAVISKTFDESLLSVIEADLDVTRNLGAFSQNSNNGEIGRYALESTYFGKDQLMARQNGTQISAECIPVMQEYFITNYQK